MAMTRIAFACIAVFATADLAWADYVGPDGRTRDCYCTDSQGGRIELGESICLEVDGRAFMAQCQMSLNVPMWRETGQGCVSSRLHDGAKPSPEGRATRQSEIAPPPAPIFANPQGRFAAPTLTPASNSASTLASARDPSSGVRTRPRAQ